VTPVTASDRFDELYLDCRDRLVQQIFVFTGDETEARDLVQQAFEKAWLRWRRVASLDDPEAWVRLVAFNLAKNHRRRRRRRQLLPSSDAPDIATDSIEEEQSLMEFRHALDQLGPQPRRALILHHLVGLSVGEVATEMAAPPGTVMSWLYRGRNQLADELDRMNASDPESPRDP
jgi:RNA polymerase sigma-70 factor (ECF subfamily)